MPYYKFDALLQKKGWIQPAWVEVDNNGKIVSVTQETPQNENRYEHIKGIALPGFINAHSHAFQYAMAGHAEIHEPDTSDDFWSWRENMYKHATRFEPDTMQQVATLLYKNMVKNGYTRVVEFHYVHHHTNGVPYDNIAEMGARLVAAAQDAGIKITLVPVYYNRGDFGKEPQPRQQRFICKDIDQYQLLLQQTTTATQYYSEASTGYGVHSLRAATAQDIQQLATDPSLSGLPFHIHAAEQRPEVERCLQYYGCRPIEWLLQHVPLSAKFNIIHATHMTDNEAEALAKTGTNVVLCPSTEGNLGDGIFNLKAYSNAGGRWSYGTDSHISLNMQEDMRWTDYAQRLLHHKRNTFSSGAAELLQQGFYGGMQAAGLSTDDYFAIGSAFDAVVFDTRHPLLEQASITNLLSVIVYTSDTSFILSTIINGRKVYTKEIV